MTAGRGVFFPGCGNTGGRGGIPAYTDHRPLPLRMRHPAACLLALLLLSPLAGAGADDAGPRPPAPPREDVRAAELEARKLFKQELADARTPEQLAALCDQMAKVAASEQEPASRRALLELALDLAGKAGDFDRAARCVHRIGKAWNDDTTAMLVEAAGDCAKNLKGNGSAAGFWEDVQAESDRLLASDDPAGARRLAEAGLAGLRSDRELAKAAGQRVANLREIEASAGQLAKAVAAGLPASRTDALRGRHLCLMADNWEAGLPFLAKGEDARLQPAAAAEVEAGDSADKLAAAAGLWETAARQETGLAQRNLNTHAADLYRAAIPKLGGLTKVKAETRLRELEAKADPGGGAPARWNAASYCGEHRERINLAGVPGELEVIPGRDNVRIAGTARVDTAQVEGKTCGHFGKAVLMTGRSSDDGQLVAAVSWKPDATHYGMLMRKKDGSVVRHDLHLEADERYAWRVHREGNEIHFDVAKGRQGIGSLRLPVAEFDGIGFSATVRRPGDRADLTIGK